MLYMLTGEVQIGKTRWLESLVEHLAAQGTPCYGVIAPGRWVESSSPMADDNGFEKLGIDNVLLPDGKRIGFALREDLAHKNGSFDETSQSAHAKLVWHISDDAIAQVNDHFASIPERATHHPGLLVIDELGRLELMRNEGLSQATALLEAGPTPALPHALIVVRDYLADIAEERFTPAWGTIERIAPNESSTKTLLSLL